MRFQLGAPGIERHSHFEMGAIACRLNEQKDHKMRLLTPSRYWLFLLTLLAAIAIASVFYIMRLHTAQLQQLQQQVEKLESESVRVKKQLKDLSYLEVRRQWWLRLEENVKRFVIPVLPAFFWP
jgi:cell division protein FtsB